MGGRNPKVRVRERLLREQDGKCFYCARPVDFMQKSRFPTVEHFIPRCHGDIGRGKNLVLACAWCDKTKGMIPGPEFVALIVEETKDKPFTKAQAGISRKAKARNAELHAAYPPNVAYRTKGPQNGSPTV